MRGKWEKGRFKRGMSVRIQKIQKKDNPDSVQLQIQARRSGKRPQTRTRRIP